MKYAIIEFSKGGGSCHDEEVRLFRAKTQKKLEENIHRYHEKYYAGWSMYVTPVTDENFDESGSMYVSSYYS